MKNNQTEAFFALLRAGLWEKDVQLLPYGKVDYEEVMRLAEEQSVVGLITAGLERVTDVTVPKKELLQFIGQTLQIEESNKAMNAFIADLVKKLRDVGIYTLLVKGQGIAQCYERPLWRASGDVDFFLAPDEYEKAKRFIISLASSSGHESEHRKHFGISVGSWSVELHGALHSELSVKIDKIIDKVQTDTFTYNKVRIWENGNKKIYLPEENNDVIFVFTHYLKHFYKGGIGIRQICDWSRLLWKYRNTINEELLLERLEEMKLVSEWRAFATIAVKTLGMSKEAMPLYEDRPNWDRKAKMILSFIISSNNRRSNSFNNYPFVIRKSISMLSRIGDATRHAKIFPLDSLRFLPYIIYDGMKSALKGEG